jgi:hypothetical protein
VSTEAPPRTLVRVLVALACVPLLTGAWLAFSQHRLVTSAQPVDAVVLESRDELVRTKKSTTRYAHVRYRYAFDGRDHESTQLYPSALYVDDPTDDLLAQYPAGARVTAWVDPAAPSRAFLLRAHSFLPYAIVLLAGPIFALAAGLVTGGLRHHRSGTPEVPDPERHGDGWYSVAPFRPYLALRNSALAAAIPISLISAAAFAHYAAVVETFDPIAALLLLVIAALVARLLWGAWIRTWAGSRLHDAELLVKPATPAAGKRFAVRLTQAAKSGVTIRAFDVTLIGERTEITKRHGRSRSRTRVFVTSHARIGESRYLVPGESLSAEHVFDVPAGAIEDGHIVKWRVAVRTRIFGGDYRTHFPFPIA